MIKPEVPALFFKNVCKSFYSGLTHISIKRVLANLLNPNKLTETKTSKVILDNVSFSVRTGEFVSIMGRNGAGKSTLLKLISGILKPDHGEIRVNGKIAPLLELGAGFSDELTGYDNIFLYGGIIGFDEKKVKKSVADIIAFSELGEDIHTELRHYSSGMIVRLGFSIAVHLDADFLLFDEVFAVGDDGFQKKCFQRISELKSGRSKTMLLVTHSPEQALFISDRVIVIDGGKKIYDGDPLLGTQVYKKLFK